jgi:probable biosynthetic protein (TIGR04099 family)
MNLPVDPGIRLRQDYLAGMPHLAYAGLSENWLLKECGHLHWLLLARLHGLDAPAFSDREGRTAYAAFIAIHLRGLQLERIGENTRFELRSRLQPAGRARHCSEHLLLAAGQPCGELTMLSTFVSRSRAGDNRSAIRAQLGAEDAAPVALGEAARTLLEAGKYWRWRTRAPSTAWQATASAAGCGWRVMPRMGAAPASIRAWLRTAAAWICWSIQPEFNAARTPPAASTCAMICRAASASVAVKDSIR